MELDPTYLTLALLFSALGMGLFLYGRKASRMSHLAAGLAMMTCPYFVTNPIAMSAICLVIGVAPFVMPEA
jgi:hypothetical protein